MNKENRQKLRMLLIVIALILGASWLGLRIASNGVLHEKFLDASVLDMQNPARVASEVQKVNSVVVVIERVSFGSLTGEKYAQGVLKDNKDIPVKVYMSDSNLAKLEIGSTVAVSGSLSYVSKGLLVGDNGQICVGTYSPVPPFSFYARFSDTYKGDD